MSTINMIGTQLNLFWTKAVDIVGHYYEYLQQQSFMHQTRPQYKKKLLTFCAIASRQEGIIMLSQKKITVVEVSEIIKNAIRAECVSDDGKKVT